MLAGGGCGEAVDRHREAREAHEPEVSGVTRTPGAKVDLPGDRHESEPSAWRPLAQQHLRGLDEDPARVAPEHLGVEIAEVGKGPRPSREDPANEG
jgi:hypothetical protein